MKKTVVGIMVALACFTTWSCNKDESLDSNKNEMVGVEVVSTDTRTPIEEYASGLRMVLEKYGHGAVSRSAASDSMMVQEIRGLVSNYINRYGKSSIASDILRPGVYSLSEDSIDIISQDMVAFQGWISKTYSPAFASSYNAITNGTYHSSLAIENNLDNMTPGERLMVVTALEIDQYEIANGREIVSEESACNRQRMQAMHACLIYFIGNTASAAALWFWNLAGFETELIIGFVSYAMCVVTVENNYRACLNRAHGNQ